MSALQAELFALPVEPKVPPSSLSRRPRRPRPIDSTQVSEEVNEWMPTTSRLSPDEMVFRARKALANHDLYLCTFCLTTTWCGLPSRSTTT